MVWIFLIDIGNGKYVLADEVVDAKPLSERKLKRLSRKYELAARNGEALITSLALTGDEFILSSLPAQQFGLLVERRFPCSSARNRPVKEIQTVRR
jgi:hypothetical protein